MAVAIDVIGTEAFHASAVSPRTYTGLTTGGSLTNGAVAFVVCYDTQVTGTAATWDGVTCTLIAATNSGGTFGRVEIWGLSPIGAHTGNKTFSVSWTGGTSAITMIAGVSFTGVNQTGGITSFPNGNTATGTSGGSGVFNPTVTITVNTNDIGIAGFTTDQNSFTSVNGTQIFRDSGANLNGAGNLGTGNGALGFAGTCTATTVNNWAAAGADILAAPSTVTSGAGILDSTVTFTRKTIFQALSFVPVVATPAVTWNAWTDWPDFAPKAKPPADILPWRFIEPAPQVFFPYDRWADTTNKAKRSADFPFETLVVPLQPTAWTQWFQWPEIDPFRAKPAVDFKPWSFVPPPAQVFYPFDRWPDIAWAAKRVAQNPDWSYGTFVTPTPAITWNAWTQWPDFATRAKPVVDFIPWSFIPPAAQVFYPFDRWPDTATKAKPAPDFVSWSFVAPYPPFPYTQWDQWPDFATKLKPAADFVPWSFVAPTQTTVWTQWSPWPDITPYRAKPSPDFVPWTFIPPAAQVWYPPGNWDDFTRKKFVQVDTQPWAGPYVTTAPVVTWNAWTDWPDFATKAKAVPEFFPWRFIEPAPQVWFPHDAWPDFNRIKPVPLNYVPLTLTQTVKTPWNTMTTWPDFAPIRGKPGLPPQLQQFLARYAGLIPLPTVSATMFAIGITSDGAVFAINVLTSKPAATAQVSIQEIGGLSATSIHEIGS